MKTLITILLILGLYFLLYGGKNTFPTHNSSELTSNSATSTKGSVSDRDGSQDKSVMDSQWNAAPNLKSFFSNIFERTSTFQTYPYGGSELMPNKSTLSRAQIRAFRTRDTDSRYDRMNKNIQRRLDRDIRNTYRRIRI